MNRGELVTEIAQRSGVSAKDVDATLKGFQDVVGETVAKGDEKIVIQGFLSFEQAQRAARKGRNPQDPTKEIQIPASKAVKISVGSKLKSQVSGK